MSTISQRQLRNDNAEVIREVQAGNTFTVTRRGVPVAVIGPVPEDTRPEPAQPARRRPTFSALTRVHLDRDSADILAEDRADS